MDSAINDSRTSLKRGTNLFDKYTIISDQPIGQGSNWLVYLCVDENGHILCIKEYYPIDESFYRDDCGFLRIEDDLKESIFHRMQISINHELKMQDAARVELINSDNKAMSAFTNWDAVYSASKMQDNKFGDTCYVIMDILSGRTLSEMIANDDAISIIEKLQVLIEIGKTISVLHKKGILHLDVKPDNFYITFSGKVIVLDFGSSIFKGNEYSEDEIRNSGIARYTEGFGITELAQITQESNIKKKQLDIAKLSNWADIYSYVVCCKRLLKIQERSEDDTLIKLNSIISCNAKEQDIDVCVQILNDRLIAEYHRIESINSLRENSRSLYDRLFKKEKYYSFYEYLLKNTKDNEYIYPQEIISSGSNVLICGREGMGKTTILMKCWEKLLNQECVSVYVDLKNSDVTSGNDENIIRYIQHTVLENYHIDIKKSSAYNIIILCDNLFNCREMNTLIQNFACENIRLIVTTMDMSDESEDEGDESPYKYDKIIISNLTADQKKRFFHEYSSLFSEELRKESDFSNIESISDLAVGKKIKLNNAYIDIEKISFVEERYRLLLKEEHIQANKLALMYGYELFFPWIAIHLYFNKDYLFLGLDNSIEELEHRISGFDYIGIPISYYRSIGLLNERRSYAYIPISNDYGEYPRITRYTPGYRIGFARERDYYYFVAKYIKNDYERQQFKKNSILCRVQLTHPVILQLSRIIDTDIINNWLTVDGMTTYRYACRNLVSILHEKWQKNERVKLGMHIFRDEIWPEIDSFDEIVDRSELKNKKKLYAKKSNQNTIDVYFGIQHSSIYTSTWEERIWESDSRKYDEPTDYNNISYGGIKNIFHVGNYTLTDSMELPILVKVKTIVGYENDGRPIHIVKTINTGTYIYDALTAGSEVIDVYDKYNLSYALVRYENPMERRTRDTFLVYSLKQKENKVEKRKLFIHEARYFKNIEYPIKIIGTDKIIAIGEVDGKTFSDFQYRTYDERNATQYTAVRFYINVNNGKWIRDIFQINGEIVTDFDVMKLSDDVSICIYLRKDGRIKRVYYKHGFCPDFESNSFVFANAKSIALLKNKKQIAFINDNKLLKLIDVEGEVLFETDLSNRDVDPSTLQALDDDYLWIKDINNERKLYIWSTDEKKLKEFEIPFD